MSTNHVVVIGGGFAGLAVARELAGSELRVTLVDRENHHLFQPLLYQVATAGLSAPEIAQPIRSILRNATNVQVVMDEVVRVLPALRRIELVESGRIEYDRLVVAAGARTNYYGHDDWAETALGLKTLEDAFAIRNAILGAFERAEREPDPERRRKLMRIVVIGGGPTGAELAGACAELTKRVLQADFRTIDPTQAEIVLLEAADRILSPFSPKLSRSAKSQLEQLGVDVRLSQEIVDVHRETIELAGETLHAGTILWGAGVRATPLAETFDAKRDRQGRFETCDDLTLPGHPEIYAIGDIARVTGPEGSEVPGLAPAAIQMGRYVGGRLRAELCEGKSDHPPFRYRDRGSMATLGRSKAVARIGERDFTGLPAWLLWLLVHLVFLVGFRNRLFVFLQWIYAYVAYRRGARIIESRRLVESSRNEDTLTVSPEASATRGSSA